MSKYEEYIKWLEDNAISEEKIEEFQLVLDSGDIPKTKYLICRAYCDGYSDGRKNMLEIFGESNVNLKKENDA